MKKELLFSVTKNDFEIECIRGHGKGGQNRNKRDTAVRIKHKESGLEAFCQDERSQLSNKQKAFKNLINKPEFKKWLKLKIAKETGKMQEIERKVEVSLKSENLKIEVKEDGKWKEINNI